MKAQSILSRILLPIDISEGSRGAAGFCSSLAKALRPSLSRMTPLYVNPVGHFSRHVGYVDFRSEEVTHDEQFLRMRAEHIRRDIMPLMEETAATLRAAAPGLQVDQMVVDGDPAHEISRVAQDGGYSTIVIATRNLPDLKRLFLGSVTRKVIGYSHCDVLAVRVSAASCSATVSVAPARRTSTPLPSTASNRLGARLFRLDIVGQGESQELQDFRISYCRTTGPGRGASVIVGRGSRPVGRVSNPAI